MESTDDLDEIFEDYEDRGNENIPENNNETNNETTGVRVQPPTKRTVKNPRLKFNPERLCGERGIPVLLNHFKDVKFKGKGYEKENLDKLLSKLEHWTHRLFPSMKFEDCINHIEKLGKKRPVQTCLRKIRLDMPIFFNNEFVKDDEEDNVQRMEDSEPVETDAFDRLIGETRDYNPIPTVESIMNSDSYSIYSSPVQQESSVVSHFQALGSTGSSLSEEQKERLERNRRLAIERRKAKLAAEQTNSMNSPLLSDENTATQEKSSVKSFDSLSSPQNDFDDINVNSTLSANKEDNKSILSELNNPNSDNLGLDDLIDLVNEEVPASEKSTVLSSEHPGVVFENAEKICDEKNKLSPFNELEEINAKNVDVNDDNNSISSELNHPNSENLGLDDLMNLVDEEEDVVSKNTTVLSSELSGLICENAEKLPAHLELNSV